ncbi:MAG: hypothetical protein GY832_05200, partial [Chloroflexi bacterium]|nr:hypothetical protein [Chloroflexota bacterium]
MLVRQRDRPHPRFVAAQKAAANRLPETFGLFVGPIAGDDDPLAVTSIGFEVRAGPHSVITR